MRGSVVLPTYVQSLYLVVITIEGQLLYVMFLFGTVSTESQVRNPVLPIITDRTQIPRYHNHIIINEFIIHIQTVHPEPCRLQLNRYPGKKEGNVLFLSFVSFHKRTPHTFYGKWLSANFPEILHG
uniref:Uncharacterized protein n=1 Tax=Cacopsylla melanoneura TaxID=428564 RepID=A0A8D9E8G7_9HEMI